MAGSMRAGGPGTLRFVQWVPSQTMVVSLPRSVSDWPTRTMLPPGPSDTNPAYVHSDGSVAITDGPGLSREGEVALGAGVLAPDALVVVADGFVTPHAESKV